MMSPAAYRNATVAALALGLGLWVWAGRPPMPAKDELRAVVFSRQNLIAVGVLLVCLAPPVTRFLDRELGRLRHPSSRDRGIITVFVLVVAVCSFYYAAVYGERWFIPKFHDERMYITQMQMLARGRLWMPQHPLADAFQTFHVMVKPKYAAIAFPGAALMFVPAVWFHLPWWLLPMCAAGALVAMLYRVVAELVDGVAGLLAAFVAIASTTLRYLSIIVMSHTVLPLLGLLMFWAWLRWRRSRRVGWAVAIGAFAGWAAITRPVEAICWAAPLGVAILLDLRDARVPWPRWATAMAAIVVGAAPFLAIQVAFNVGVTGSPFRSAYQEYFARYLPQSSIGFHTYDPNLKPNTTLPQRLEYYQEFDVRFITRHRVDRLVETWRDERTKYILDPAVPHRLLWILLPVGVLGLVTRPRRALAAVLPLFVGIYFWFTYLLPHYSVAVLPSLVLILVCAPGALQRTWPRLRLEMPATLAIAALSLTGLPQVNPNVVDDPYNLGLLWIDHFELPKLVTKPAIVLFKYQPGGNTHEEPVYNYDVAWPDDAEIIRAHDLGPEKNLELLEYYAARQPGRHVYFFDRGTGTTTSVGTVGELWAKLRPRAATTTAPAATLTSPSTRPATSPR
jgi:hypothetical protein